MAALCGVVVALFGCGGERPEAHPGKAIYLRHCYACHQAGVAGAPQLGDPAAWTPRLAKGRDAINANVQRGMTPGMPPRGACPSCTDEALALAVDFMLAQLREP